MRTHYFLFVIMTFTLMYSCKKKEPVPEPFDHAAQALIDDTILRTYLETHFYTPPENSSFFGEVDTILNGETPIINQIITKETTYNGVAFKVYVLKNIPEGVGVSPSKVDSALVNYKGQLLDAERTVFDEKQTYFWANLYEGLIPAWTHALPEFKGGVNTSQPDAPLSFEQAGTGVFFLPSGLGYSNFGKGTIPANAPLMFHVELAMVKRADKDADGIKSIFEDLDNDGTFTDDDSDSDGTANFLDIDDDDDRILTKYEHADLNGDGNPDDAIDTDNDGKPDYIDNDDDNDGILTKLEHSDPNNDGNPEDARDTDGDNIPDYLDAN